MLTRGPNTQILFQIAKSFKTLLLTNNCIVEVVFLSRIEEAPKMDYFVDFFFT